MDKSDYNKSNSFPIGEHIKSIRKKNSITLKDLANRTGLSIGYLSNIEHNRTSPTLENLSCICEAMQHDLLNVINESIKRSPVIKKNERILLYKRKDRIQSELMTSPGQKMRGVCFSISGEYNDEEISWGHEYDEYFVVASGAIKMTLRDAEEYLLEEGDAIYIAAKTSHKFRKMGDEDVVLYITSSISDV